MYLIQGTSGERRRRLAPATSTYCNITGPGAEETLVWWLKDLRGVHDTGQRLDGIPLFAGLSYGPYRAEDLLRQIAGRVVGFAHKSFGKVIAPSAGFHDEAGGNAAFDPAAYLDVLIATGHEPYICGGAYFESPPERALSDAERKQVLAVHSKFCRGLHRPPARKAGMHSTRLGQGQPRGMSNPIIAASVTTSGERAPHTDGD